MTVQSREVPPWVADLQKHLRSAAEDAFKDVEDYVSFTLQIAYVKCAYECFDRNRAHRDNAKCVDRCGRPVAQASNTVQTEISKFQDRILEKYMACKDKFDAEKLASQENASSRSYLETCMEKVVNEQMQALPLLVAEIKSRLPQVQIEN